MSNDRDEKKQIAELVSSDQQKDAICNADNNKGGRNADFENQFLSKLMQKLDQEYKTTGKNVRAVVMLFSFAVRLSKNYNPHHY